MIHRCVFAQTNKCSDITEPITDHTSLGLPGLPPVPASECRDRSAGASRTCRPDRPILPCCCGHASTRPPTHEGRYVGALAGWSAPDRSASFFRADDVDHGVDQRQVGEGRGKLPGAVRYAASAYRCSGLAKDSSRSHRCWPVDLADLHQRRHQPERADGEGALLAGEPVVGLLDAVTQHQPVLGELVGDGQHGRA